MKNFFHSLLALLFAFNADASIRGASVGVGGGTPAVYPSQFAPYVAATAGDSIMAQGFSSAGGSSGGPNFTYSNINPLTQLRNLLGGRIYIPLVNVFAVSGSFCNAANQIPAYYTNAVNSGTNIIFGDGCRNDLAAGGSSGTSSAIISNIMPSIAKVSNSSSRLIFMPLLPENAYTTLQRQYRIVVNRLFYELASGQRPDLVSLYGLNPNNLPIILDDAFIENFANGGRNPGWGVSDGIHLTGSGTFKFAQQEAAILSSPLPPRPTFINYFEDYYDATNNPQGNLLSSGTSNLGLMTGTGGSVYTFNGVTPTGQVATGYQALRNQGTSTATFVLSKEVTRADGLTGTGQVLTINCSGGQNYEQYRLQFTGTMPVVTGRTLYATGTWQLLGTPSNFLGVSILAGESGPATPQSTTDGEPNQDANNFDMADAAGDQFLRAPPFPVQSTTTSLYFYAFVYLNCSTSASVSIALRDLGVRYQ